MATFSAIFSQYNLYLSEKLQCGTAGHKRRQYRRSSILKVYIRNRPRYNTRRKIYSDDNPGKLRYQKKVIDYKEDDLNGSRVKVKTHEENLTS